MSWFRKAAVDALGWVDTRRSAVATINWLRRNGIIPRTLVDAGANNSQWTMRLAREFQLAKIVSFEPQASCRPLGRWHRVGLSDKDEELAVSGSGTSAVMVPVSGKATSHAVHAYRLDRYANEFIWPAVLKVDTEDHTYRTLVGAGDCLGKFACVVVEIWEGLEAPCAGRNKHAEIHALMWKRGFNRAMTVGASAWRNHVSITDSLFWKE